MPSYRRSGDERGLDVLVVGAGPTGLLLACELARRGVACRVIDEREAPLPWSRALGMHARTLEILDTLGLADAALALGRPVRGIRIHARRGNPNRPAARIASFDLADLDSPYRMVLSIPQSATEELLAARARELGVAIDRRVRLVGLAADAAGATATLEHASDGRIETARVPCVAGCDGAHSTVRKQLGSPFAGTAYPESFALADVRLSWRRKDDWAQVFFAEGGLLGAIPMPEPDGEPAGAPGTPYRLVADLRRPAPGERAFEPTLAAFQRLCAERGAPDATLHAATWMDVFRIHRRIVPRMRIGRVLLAGDAAHIHSPVAGQGMNTGLQDAHNLGWKLALVVHRQAAPGLLDTYEAERRPVAESILRGTDVATRVVTLESPAARAVRDVLIELLAPIGPVRRALGRGVAEIGLGYRDSPIVREERAPRGAGGPHPLRARAAVRLGLASAPHPGDRAPDVRIGEGGGGARLFDVLRGPGHVLLLFEGRAPEASTRADLLAVARAVLARHGDHVTAHLVARRARAGPAPRGAAIFLDPELRLHARYGADLPCAYVVRPDGHVGYRAAPPRAPDLLDWMRLVVRPTLEEVRWRPLPGDAHPG